MSYLREYNNWINNPYFDIETKNELISIKDNLPEIEDRFYTNLDFGTAGLRGIIGAGSNRINKYTISRATFGLAQYLLDTYDEYTLQNGVVIAHDNRYMSRDFCIQTAETLSACNIKAYIFDDLRTTPELSFAVRHLKCVAGIVITASHNPPQYNGYKVYGPDGSQILPHVAKQIISKINSITDYSSIPTTTNENLIEVLSPDIDQAYIDAIKSYLPRLDIIPSYSDNLKIVFTPLCGAGRTPVLNALSSVGFENVLTVKEEESPDPTFAGISSPNPEDKKALSRAIELGKLTYSDLIIGTDPDCDRVGVAVKNYNDDFILLSGNDIGALLTYYLLSFYKSNDLLPDNAAIIKSIVTSDFGKAIANEYNVQCIEVLTGFKFIGDKINKFEQDNSHSFILGYEESYGYLAGTHARDKDGVLSSLLICEMAAYYKSHGRTLLDVLNALKESFGYYKEQTISLSFEGIEGKAKINNIMNYFRNKNVSHIGTTRVKNKVDYINGVGSLPPSDVIKLFLQDGSWIAIRPSGTEPKIKFYIASSSTNPAKTPATLSALRKSIKILTRNITNFDI